MNVLRQIMRRVIDALQGPLPQRPKTNDPHEIDKFYVQRYAPRRSSRAPRRIGAAAHPRDGA